MPDSFASALAAAVNPPEIDAFRLLGYEPACVPFVAGQIEAPCGECPQEQFASATEYSVLLGGASGGGKSLAALAFALRECVRHPGIRVGAFRRSYPELRDSLIAELAQHFGFAEALNASWNGSEFELRFKNGSVLLFRYAETYQDATRRQGAQFQLLVLDERCLFPDEVVKFLESRVRSGRADIPVIGIRSTANPGGPSHSQVKAEFVDSTNYGERVVTDTRGRTVRFIPAGIASNPYINAEYAADLRGLPEKLRRAFLDGDWTAFAGMMFPELDRAVHVVRPFAIPSSWQKVAGIDWGFTAPFACIWLAQDEDHRLWAFREAYRTELGEEDQARLILEAEGDEQVTRFADSAMWATRGAVRSIADAYQAEGCDIIPAAKGPGSRVSGWARIHTYLSPGPACPMHRQQGLTECPRIHFFSTLEHTWTELSGLCHASVGNVEDADPKAPDHICDALRYALSGIGTGPDFPQLADVQQPAYRDPWGQEVMQQRGNWAMRLAPDDAWASAAREPGDEPESRGGQRAPWSQEP